MNGKERVEAFLAHYSSDYYDPEKAREYYLRTRELKGRKAAEMNTTQREAFGYAKTQISEKRKEAKTTAQVNQVQKLEELRKKAVETQARIEAQLAEYFTQIQTELKIPANASPKLRAFLQKNQNQRMASAKQASAKKRREVGLALRSALTEARESYATASKALDTKYDTDSETEYQNIRANVK